MTSSEYIQLKKKLHLASVELPFAFKTAFSFKAQIQQAAGKTLRDSGLYWHDIFHGTDIVTHPKKTRSVSLVEPASRRWVHCGYKRIEIVSNNTRAGCSI